MAQRTSRHQRIEAQMQRTLAELVPRAVKDPRVGKLTITAVSLLEDLSAARVWFLRQFEPGESLAAPILSATGTPAVQSLPGTAFLRDFSPGTYTFTVPSFGVDTGQVATVQLAAGTQTFLEVQSLRSWAGAGGDHFQRDTLYVRAISAYWAEKYFPTLTYLGPR